LAALSIQYNYYINSLLIIMNILLLSLFKKLKKHMISLY